MVAAYILIQTEVGKAAQVAKDIVEIKGVQQALVGGRVRPRAQVEGSADWRS